MPFRYIPAILLPLFLGCNTFADVDFPESGGTSPNSGLDAGTTDAEVSPDVSLVDASSSDASEVDQGTQSPRFQVSDLTVIPFTEEHEIDTSVAILTDTAAGHIVSLAYRYDPTGTKIHGYVASTSVGTVQFGDALIDEISANEPIKSVAVMRDGSATDELIFSASFDSDCSTTGAVLNSSHRYGLPGDTSEVNGARNCDVPDNPIDVVGNINIAPMADGSVRYGSIINSNNSSFLTTSTLTNSTIDYLEIRLSGEPLRSAELLSASGLFAVYNPNEQLMTLWSGLGGESTTATADPQTTAEIELESELAEWTLSGVFPGRYELWAASYRSLTRFPVPCSVDGGSGYVDCQSSTITDGAQTLSLAGAIIDIDATRAGEVAMAAVLTADGPDHALDLVVDDGNRLETVAVAAELPDMLDHELSIDAFRVDSNRWIVAIATSMPSLDNPSTILTDVYTFELLRLELPTN